MSWLPFGGRQGVTCEPWESDRVHSLPSHSFLDLLRPDIHPTAFLKPLLPMLPSKVLLQPPTPIPTGPAYVLETLWLSHCSVSPSFADVSFSARILSVNASSDFCYWPFSVPLLNRGHQI